ncbi:response regulator [Luteolibacter algae]|uniref:histidine kinase n=1 Tax=Luteolibacter algae TaxID=454151 RepID=A0ABW5D7U8_9BACT
MVDDHEENLRIIAGVLGPHGYDLMPALNATQVFERMASRVPDLILLDVVLPDMNGIEICRRLKQNEKWNEIPVIFLSAADDKSLVVEALESGGVDYISKPFNQAELISRVRTHLLLKQTRDDLALLAADKDELLRVMAHDFKNQLSGVLMSAKLLLERKESAALPERSLKLIRNMWESSDRMMGFLKSFLANQGARRQSLEVRPVDLEELISSCIAEVEPSALVKGTKIKRAKGEGVGKVLMDSNAGRQVIGNLIENAIKFCPMRSEVCISTSLGDSGMALIEVVDNGPGFTPEDRTRMFERYSRLSARPSGGEPSTGLGLFIVKSLVLAMGGRIRLADDEPGEKGARFLLEFKIAD